MNIMNAIRKMKWIIAAVFLCYFTNQVTAAEYSWNQSSGNHVISITTNEAGNTVINGNVYTAISAISVSGGTLTINFGNTSPVILNGTILLTGGTINIVRTGPASTEDNPTLKKKNGNLNARIEVRPPSNGSATLNFNNDANYPLFVYDGGCMNFRIEPYGNFYKANADGQSKNYALVKMSGGVCRMQNTVLTNNWNAYADGATGGAFDIYKNSAGRGFTLEMTNCTIKNCYAKESGSAIYFVDSYNNGSSITMTDCDVTNCFVYASGGQNGQGGTIRTLSSNYASFTMIGCNMYGNYSVRGGAGILWNAARAPMPHLEDCSFTDNWEGLIGGGALYIQGSMELVRCDITNNHSLASGGGVFYSSPSPPAGLSGYTPGTSATLTIDDQTVISNNEAAVDGGGLYVYTKAINSSYHVTEYTLNLEVNGATISDNKAGRNGGAIYLTKDDVPYTSELHINYGSISRNRAMGNGGAVCVEGLENNPLPAFIGTPTGTEDLVIANDTATNGGGIYVKYGDVTFYRGQMGGVDLTDPTHPVYLTNVASGGDGGGIYVDGGSFKMYGGTFAYNEATKSGGTGGNGGGFYVTDGQVEIKGGTISNNTADVNGGGFYVGPGAGNTTTINSDNANTNITGNTAKNGGGAFVGSGKLDVASTNGNTVSICNNTATVNGGGIYADHDVEINGITVCNNGAVDGGGLYVEDGEIEVKNGCDITGNTATRNGGGIYANNDVDITGSTIGSNTAVNGAGLYANAGTVDFSSGTFDSNSATGNGGGLYVANGATVLLSGTATLTKNHVPYANGENIGHGGGIYLAGTVKVGRNANDPQGTHSLNVQDNYQDTESNLNNIYLAGDNKVIELLSDMRNSSTKLGFSVNSGFRKVVYHAGDDATNEANSWLHGLLTEGGTQGLTGVIFDDSRKYMAVHVLTLTDQTFDHEYIYLWGCWISAVDKDPQAHPDEYPLPSGVASHYTIDTDGTWHIWTKEGLAWFSSYVNGLNGFPYNENVNPAAKAVMEADVDMNEYLWVPIGSAAKFEPTSTDPTSAIFTDGHKFKGEFDGKGHIIRGLDCRYINSIHNYGLFGETFGNANITNTFVDAFRFDSNQETGAYQMGGIAGTATGNTVIANCEARGTMTAPNSDEAVLGSVVGVLDGNATVHSSIGLADMSGKAAHMGGLVGLVKSNAKLANSYSNATYSPVATSSAKIGALAGTNFGTIENCYVISLRGTTPSNFQWFAGSNSGTIDYCYAPTEATGVQTGTNGNYAATALVNGKYGYAHQDQDVTATNKYKENGPIGNDGELKGLLATLNNWVEDQTDGVAYSTWTRTMASPMNADLPILEFDDFACASTRDNIFIAYKDDLNDMIDYANANSTGGSVYLYDATPTAVNKNTNGNVRVYIAPNVGITQADGNTINARVGVTLDNSSTDFMAYDWHMFSPALTDAPMGLTYNSMVSSYPIYNNYSNYKANGIPESVYSSNDINPRETAWNTTAGNIGYFPTNTPYGAPYSTLGCFDFYCYSEEYTHWANFKREGKRSPEFFDHWRQNADENGNHQNIPYENETTMKRGKGYMVAITEPSMLMTDGTLDNNQVTVPVTNTTSLTGYEAPLKGVNLIGNPYQAYLDFNKIGNDLNTYFILDAYAHGYIAYVSDGSTPDVPGVVNGNAPRYIHPHQGFFVHVPQGTTSLILNNTMIEAGDGTAQNSTFRSAANHYPMVTLAVEDGRGRRDYTTVELDRPETGGGEKIQGLHAGDASLWVRHDDTDWQVAFTKPGTREVPVRFKAYQDGTFTLSWGAYNGYFSYLHLIDNLTGTDIDCLTTDEYRFEAKTSDYTSRFRLVFDFTGVEENDEPTEGPTSFAFMMGDELVINGEGVLQMFDLNGRQLFSTEIHGTQATVAMPKVADGIYVLRLTNGNQVRTQKMVINK